MAGFKSERMAGFNLECMAVSSESAHNRRIVIVGVTDQPLVDRLPFVTAQLCVLYFFGGCPVDWRSVWTFTLNRASTLAAKRGQLTRGQWCPNTKTRGPLQPFARIVVALGSHRWHANQNRKSYKH
jgi:hypothetical protein